MTNLYEASPEGKSPFIEIKPSDKREDQPEFEALKVAHSRAKADKVPDASIVALLRRHKDASGHVPIEHCRACAAELETLRTFHTLCA